MGDVTGLLVVHSGPVDGQEDEYNEWYSNHHIPHVVATPGFISGQRFRIHGVQRLGADHPVSVHRYLSIYEVTGDPALAFQEMNARLADGRMPVSDAIDEARIQSFFWQPITERVTQLRPR
jgi:hypothetical protein